MQNEVGLNKEMTPNNFSIWLATYYTSGRVRVSSDERIFL